MGRYLTIGMVVTTLAVAGVLTGCCGPVMKHQKQANLVKVNYCAVDHLVRKARQRPPKDSRILCASFVDLDDLTTTTPLGRLLGEVCSARLSQKGFDVVCAKLRKDSMVIRPADGEFLLTRSIKELSANYCAEVVLVGTYTRTRVVRHIRADYLELEQIDPLFDPDPNHCPRKFTVIDDGLYVSLRLVNAADNSVLAAYDYRVAIDDGIRSLLLGQGILE
jgi:hypothetical protein